MAVKITGIDAGSPAEKAGVKAGETLVSINQNPITDVLDYRFYMFDSHLSLLLMGQDRSLRTVELDKEEYDDLGLEFETFLMDKQMGCHNKCIFCFVDQTPKGMRKSLYFKDDDTRMSFLFGSYTTLTNLKEEDIHRIIKMKISPINISVHTTNPELRVKMMGNKTAGEKLRFIKMLTDGGIKVNSQLVLCPGINDGEELERSMADLAQLTPNLQSIAVVPVGITKHREGLFPLTVYDKEGAKRVVETVEAYGERFLKEHGERITYAADEFYLKAQLPIPTAEFYGEFAQLENGVGMMALMDDEFTAALEDAEDSGEIVNATVATGTAAYDFICGLVERAKEKFTGCNVQVKAITNDFFGHEVTVAGLVTGRDLTAQLAGKELGEKVIIPSCMLRHEQDRFLDDMTLEEAEEKLGVPIQVIENDGYLFLDAVTIKDF
ncbi:MAG: DUF512 domain-containing protein [Oscillospiraceae bacterium]|nr:DUF512 domain-containing protein [Oscillospiraceae bacterium]